MEKVTFIGLDVDDKAFHACGMDKQSNKLFQFSCKPNGGALQMKLNKFVTEDIGAKIFYEATYLGFSLCRDLKARGFDCDVIAPSLTPIIPGERVKTNRLDCEKLADYGSKNLLTTIHIPSEEEETVRDLVRGRRFFTDELRRQKQYVLSLCRRMGWDYRGETREKTYWTSRHFTWLENHKKQSPHPALQFNLGKCMDQIKLLRVQIEEYETEIVKISEQPFYRQKIEALCCFRGIDTTTAMTLIVEIGDPNRFPSPTKLTSYCGMDLCEYSSGKEKRWGITKMGNHHIRTASVESVQSAWRSPTVSKRLKALRQGKDPKFIEIADRCMRRLYKKSMRLSFANKAKNKIKVACAREMLGFVWEALRAAA